MATIVLVTGTTFAVSAAFVVIFDLPRIDYMRVLGVFSMVNMVVSIVLFVIAELKEPRWPPPPKDEQQPLLPDKGRLV